MPNDGSYNSQLGAQIDAFVDNLETVANERREQLKKMGDEGLLQWCQDANGTKYSEYTDEDACKGAGYQWKDQRPFTDKWKEKTDAWKHALGKPDRHLEAIKEKLQKKMLKMSENSNPRIKLAHKSEYVKIKYGVFRQAALAKQDWMKFEYDGTRDSFRLPKSIELFGGDPDKIDYTEDANLYLGITKASIAQALGHTEIDLATLHNGKKSLTAAFSMGLKSAQFFPKVGPGGTDELKLTFYTMPEKNESIPSDDFTQFFPVDMSVDIYDNQDIYIGRYIDPDAASVDITSTFLNFWQNDIQNGFHKANNKFAQDVLTMAQEEIFSREFFCCVFFELISGIPHYQDYVGENLGLDPNHLEKVYIWWIEQKLKNESDPAEIARLEAEKEEWEIKNILLNNF